MRRLVVWMYAPETPHWSMPEWSLEGIREALDPGWRVDSVRVALDATGDGVRVTPPQVLEAVREAEVYFGWGIRRDVFLAARRLRWFHSGAAGARNSLFGEMRQSDVIFTNSAGMYADALADHALAGILYFARGLDVATRAQREGVWAQSELNAPQSPLHAVPPGGEVAGATLGIVGYGGIGSALGRRAHALGMRVQAIRRRPRLASLGRASGGGTPRGGAGASADPDARDLPPEVERLEGPGFLSTLLASSDYVALTAPETPETRRMIGAGELDRMQPGAVLINLARGTLVDEEALVKALKTRRLRGALLDVFETEPLPAGHPLWRLENVLVTPHVGGTSANFWRRETDLIVRNIVRYQRGEPLANQVDKAHGY